jgi:hypothetical protein
MTDQIADARPPTRADHAERLRDMSLRHERAAERSHSNPVDGAVRLSGHLGDVAACLAGAAALEEVATLRAERDKWKQEAADLYHRNEILGTDAHYAEREAVALRARVQHLTEALEGMLAALSSPEDAEGLCVAHGEELDLCDGCLYDRQKRMKAAADVARAALTPPASTEGSNG